MTFHPEYEIGPRSPGVWREVRRLEAENEKQRARNFKLVAEILSLREEIARYKADPTLLLAVDESKVIYFPEEE